MQQKRAAYQRGPHASAAYHHSSFLLADMYDYVQMGYWTVLPFQAVASQWHLQLSPAGVVPQRERRPRPIMDYSFSMVNQNSVPLHPSHAMQFGATLQRLLQRLVYCNPRHGPPLMAKVDLADGYYRVPLSPRAALQLAVVLPADNNSHPLIALPLTLPMGWAQSPPFFCAYTETIADMANSTSTLTPSTSLPHPLLAPSQTHEDATTTTFHPSATVLGSPNTPPLAYTDVYVDDFITMAQRPHHLPTLSHLLHTIDAVFPNPPNTVRRPVISAKKMVQGDMSFSTRKRILGWDVDTQSMTLHLPPHRLQNMRQLLLPLLHQHRTSAKKWRQLLGVLRSTTPALYGAHHLFSILQHAQKHSCRGRIRLTKLVKAVLRDWLHLAAVAVEVPVPLHTLVPHAPSIIAATDASKSGMGGFWLDGTGPSTANYLWRHPFPAAIQERLITLDNPSGTLTNSDLELAAVITGAHLAAHHYEGQHPNIVIATDNTPALAWVSKGSTSSTAAPAFLLHYLAQLRRAHKFTLNPVFVPGVTNQVADCCSRLSHLSDDNFLAYMNNTFPVQPSWTLVTPPTATNSCVNLALSKRLLPLASPTLAAVPMKPHGTSGAPSAKTCTLTPSFPNSMIPSLSSRYSPTDIATVQWLPPGLQSVLERWKVPFVPWGRRSPHWDAWIPAS
jgi:hypothetical protein